MNRFFIEKSGISGGRAVIEGEDAKHIASVLRLTKGENVALCDAQGTDYVAVILSASRERVETEIISQSPSLSEPDVKVTLFQGLPKAGKLESIIQKCVELGISEIAPFLARRSVVRITPAEFEKKRARYQRVAFEAAKQSGRAIIPTVAPLITTPQIDPSKFDAFFLPYEEERETGIKQALSSARGAKRVGLAIGPEGGFDEGEIRGLTAGGARTVTLGRRILRTETAGPATLAMIMYELEQCK